MRLPQVNSVTAWIDGSSIYGPSSSWSDSLRSFSGGLLTSGSEWNMPSQGGGRNFMWSSPDPSTGEHGSQGLYGEAVHSNASSFIAGCNERPVFGPQKLDPVKCSRLFINLLYSNEIFIRFKRKLCSNNHHGDTAHCQGQRNSLQTTFHP